MLWEKFGTCKVPAVSPFWSSGRYGEGGPFRSRLRTRGVDGPGRRVVSDGEATRADFGWVKLCCWCAGHSFRLQTPTPNWAGSEQRQFLPKKAPSGDNFRFFRVKQASALISALVPA